ncbi:unnamed protein product [Plutella xylostella]|uniref:(diamondback moth) hypothetical protein n=1 Tax=Plutella xylostella TaxID=51655 RepID=A0A8S4DQE0_PLUXY|nr:unnamed protein product [Plutella xylostella]
MSECPLRGTHRCACQVDVNILYCVSLTAFFLWNVSVICNRNALSVPMSLCICKFGEGGGGGARRCARDAAASPAQQQATPLVKTERLSPHDNRSSASRSRSVTPSTSSYPATPPSRGSPHAPPAPAPPAPRNYSDIMRSLAARYNTQHTSE